MSNNLIKLALSVLFTLPTFAAGPLSPLNSYIFTIVPYGLCVLLLIIIVSMTFSLKRVKRYEVKENESLEEDGSSLAIKEYVKKIEGGLDNEEFKMYLQFIVDNKTKKITSAEALSRWEDSDGIAVPPFKYIDVMEENGLISRLDYYMFEMACKKLESWKNTDLEDVTISCNFTRITISEKDFVSKIKEIAEKYSFDRTKLWIEITEDAVEKNLDKAMNNILNIKELGFKIALDDIGAGYTSFINLCEYPLDMVKIDRDILLKTDKARGKKLFLGIISLAHFLNLEVVCEGVETAEHNALVSESNCDYIQGWYYSKALPESDAEAFAREYMKVS